MQQRKRLPDFRVASTRQPAGLPGGQCRDVTPERLDEKCFGKAGQHGFSASGQGAGLSHGKPDCVLKPQPCTFLPDIHFENPRESREQNSAQFLIAGQLAANKLRHLAAASEAGHPKTLFHDPVELAFVVHGVRSDRARDDASVSVREYHDVTGGKWQELVTSQTGDSMALS